MFTNAQNVVLYRLLIWPRCGSEQNVQKRCETGTVNLPPAHVVLEELVVGVQNGSSIKGG